MNRSSIFKKKIDFKKSSGSYLFDKNTNDNYLDFFGQYSSLAIGYNHPIFKSSSYIEDINRVAHQKITNCEIFSDESMEFDKSFREFTSNDNFEYYHYCCTGALAIESAIKTAMDYKGEGFQKVISFKKSFHGINGYGGIFTDRFNPVNKRLDGFPGSYWKRFNNPVIDYKDNSALIDKNFVKSVLDDIEDSIKKDKDVCAILVEPIQCTYGDRYFPKIFFSGLRNISDNYDIPLIFDEIQIGFAVTGKLWYYEKIGIEPDILVYGKKTQLSGIAVKKKFGKIFNNSIRLEVTWDADIIDMIRCKYIMDVYKKNNILNYVMSVSDYFKEELSKIKKLKNLRNSGLLFAFDFSSRMERDSFVEFLHKNKMLCNPTGEKSIRLRPNLCVSKSEINIALEIITNFYNTI